MTPFDKLIRDAIEQSHLQEMEEATGLVIVFLDPEVGSVWSVGPWDKEHFGAAMTYAERVVNEITQATGGPRIHSKIVLLFDPESGWAR